MVKKDLLVTGLTQDQLAEKFGNETLPVDTVFQVSLQLFQLTEPKKEPTKS